MKSWGLAGTSKTLENQITKTIKELNSYQWAEQYVTIYLNMVSNAVI